MHPALPAEIRRSMRVLLVAHDTSIAALARELGVARQVMSLVFNGRGRSARIRQFLADRLGPQVLAYLPPGGRPPARSVAAKSTKRKVRRAG
jgi:hypothetical protein